MFVTRYLSVFDIDDERLLLVNTLSGAVDIIERESKKKLDAFLNGKTEVADRNLIGTLLERGYLFSEIEDEARFLEEISAAALERISSAPATFVISPTGRCNCECRYCYAKSLLEQDAILTHDMVERIFDAIEIFELMIPSCGSKLTLSGGEPLLAETFDIVSHILEKASTKGMSVSLQTNGIELHPFIPLLQKTGDCLEQLEITLDGPKTVHDSRRRCAQFDSAFDATVESIQSALDGGLNVRLRTNLDAENIYALPELAAFVVASGWPKYEHFSCSLAPVTERHAKVKSFSVIDEGAILSRLFELFDRCPDLSIFDVRLFRAHTPLLPVACPEMSKGSSFAPQFDYCEGTRLRSLAFAPDGFIYPCAVSQGRTELALGSYHPAYTLDARKLRSWADRTVATLPKCKECTVSTLCGGGCPLEAIIVNGSIDLPACPDLLSVLRAEADAVRKRVLEPLMSKAGD